MAPVWAEEGRTEETELGRAKQRGQETD